jgi:hypothetical protein
MEGDNRFHRALAAWDGVVDPQLFVGAKRFQQSVERSQATVSYGSFHAQNAGQTVDEDAESKVDTQSFADIQQSSSRSPESQDEIVPDFNPTTKRSRPMPEAFIEDTAIPWSAPSELDPDSLTSHVSLSGHAPDAEQSSSRAVQAINAEDVSFNLTLTPLPAPVARHGPPPTWLAHLKQHTDSSVHYVGRSTTQHSFGTNSSWGSKYFSNRSNGRSSHVSSSASSVSPESSAVDFEGLFYEPAKQCKTSRLNQTATPTTLHNATSPNIALVTSAPAASFAPLLPAVNVYGNATINNNTINVSVQSEKSRSLLKRALSQSTRKVFDKSTGLAAVPDVARDQTEQLFSGIRSGT